MFSGQLQKGIGSLRCGPDRCIFPHSDCNASQDVYTLQFQKQELSVKISTIWPFPSPSCVYEMYESCPVSPVGQGNMNSTISERLAGLWSDEGTIYPQYTAANRPCGQVGSLSEQGKELSVPCTIPFIWMNISSVPMRAQSQYPKPPCPVSSGSVSTVWSVPEADQGC